MHAEQCEGQEAVSQGSARRGASARVTRALLGVAACLGLLLTAQVAAGGPASAHSRLQTTVPAAGAAVDASPAAITLTFNEPVSVTYSEVTVTGPDPDLGTWQTGKLISHGKTVTQAVNPLGPAGVYEVTWRVVSTDGHPVRGTFTFTLTTAGGGSAVGAAAPSPAEVPGPASAAQVEPGVTARPGEAGRLPLVGLLAAAAVVLGGAAAWVSRRSRREGRP